jgi:RNA polymerase sigma-70 factor (ECF subfamily)
MAPSLTWTIPTPWTVMASADVQLTTLDERALVDACVKGRPGAFDLLVDRHKRAVYQICYRFVGNHEDASDLSQDVFLRAYRGLRSFRGQSSLSTWFYRIAVNVCLNRVSSKAPLLQTSESVDDHQFTDETEESATDRLLRAERVRTVRRAVAQLPRKQRLTVVLRVFHDMSHQEIADILGSSVGAVKANFFHAMGNLRRILADR